MSGLEFHHDAANDIAAGEDAVAAVLRQVFGHHTLRPEQEQVVRQILKGRSALAVLPTGAGKSLCYQLPALLRQGMGLVVSPLLALMKDQVDGLVRRGIAAARWDSTLSAGEVIELHQRVMAGQIKLLYVAPERLADPRFLSVIAAVRLSLVAVDEAHCVVEWGHQFRPEYLKVARWCQQQQDVPILVVTATATAAVIAELRQRFAMEAWGEVRASVRRDNLQLQVSCGHDAGWQDWLVTRLRETPGPKIVYVNWQQRAESVATWLLSEKLNAQAYHAALPVELKRTIQERFLAGEIEVMVATMAFGMGIDKADVRGVYHLQLPKSLEQYAQEIGRAGRDGQVARCEMLVTAEDVIALRNRMLAQGLAAGALQRLIERTLLRGREFWVSFPELALVYDAEEDRLKMLFALMEQEGVLERLGSRHSVYWLRPLRRIEQVIAGESSERQQLLRQFWKNIATQRSRWRVDVEQEADRLAQTPEQLMELLHDLGDAGDVALTRSGLQHRYRATAPAGRLRQWATDFEQRLLVIEAREQDRLQQVVDFAQACSGCWAQRLAQHFDDDDAPCHGCASCIEPSRMVHRYEPRAHVDAETWALLRSMRHNSSAALRSTRQRARFLCGLSSPALRRAKLTTTNGFGAFADYDFRQVCEWLES